jgi:hypothetical protein
MKILLTVFLFLIIYHANATITGCKTGKEDDNGACIECDTNYVKNDLGACDICDTTSKVFYNNVCFDPIPHCKSNGYKLYRPNLQICELCDSPYSPYSGSCVKLVSNCEDYDDQGNCESCRTGYFLEDEICKFYAADCTSWDDDTNKCQACRSGCLKEENGACTCFDFCEDINSSSKKCTQCITSISNYLKLEDSGCTIISRKDNCKTQTQETCDLCEDNYKKDDSGSCIACDDNSNKEVLKCNAELHGCKSARYNAQSKLIECQECTDNTHHIVEPFKQQCTIDGNYYIDETHTVSMANDSTEKLDNCISYGLEESNIVCTKCTPGYQLILGKCYECPKQYVSDIGDGEQCYLPILYCRGYSNSGDCLDCADGFESINGICFPLPIKEPARNNSYRINFNIILIMIIIGLF